MEKDAIAVFTARSPARIVEEKGSQAWVLNPVRAKQCKWLVCTQNRHHPNHAFSDATEPHGAAFLIGKISAIRQSPERPSERWLIEISEYARILQPDVWQHWRNPVRYASLDELGIDVSELQFEAIPAAQQEARPQALTASSAPAVLTIAEAKKALAAAYGVRPDAVEIIIRG
jgi:hypothetical protein